MSTAKSSSPSWLSRCPPWILVAAAALFLFTRHSSAARAPVRDAPSEGWAFRALTPPPIPKATVSGSDGNEIDRFLDQELERRQIEPSPAADRNVLIRRIAFDLTGLPPHPRDVETFLRDQSTDAWRRLVDRLLDSPAYGERWARHWLDVVRYADFHDANPKARVPSCEPLEAFRYRDWVVSVLNRDLPYTTFIIHQIAGDLLPSPPDKETYDDGLAATTFLSNGVWDRGDADKEKIVSDMVDDQIDTIGKAFLGLTLSCARCHDHKFDPISQLDYYALAGVFYSTRVLDELGTKGGEYTLLRTPLISDRETSYRRAKEKQLALLDEEIKKLDQLKPPAPSDHPVRRRLTHQRDLFKKTMPPPIPTALAAREGGTPGGLFPKIQDVPLHIRGQYYQLGELVPRRLPVFMDSETNRLGQRGSGRLELARWIASTNNPFTARVLVNRVWQYHWGEGLVRTPGNFGKLGEKPSHPELLDWLASAFIRDGWSIKSLHRRILLSNAYQRSSRASGSTLDRDPENRWLGRFTSKRLEAEAIRDSILSATGSLSRHPGGPADDDLHSARRSLYVQTARWDRGSFAMLFDAANPDASVDKRFTSTVAPQSLFLLNHPFMLEHSRRLANQLLRDHSSDRDRVRAAYGQLYSRNPTDMELAIGTDFVAGSSSTEIIEKWIDYAHLLLCANELVQIEQPRSHPK